MDCCTRPVHTLGYIHYQTSLHEYKCLTEMNLNRFTIFILLYKDDLISHQSTNQHRNVLEITEVAVKNSFKQVVIVNLFFTVEKCYPAFPRVSI